MIALDNRRTALLSHQHRPPAAGFSIGVPSGLRGLPRVHEAHLSLWIDVNDPCSSGNSMGYVRYEFDPSEQQ